MAGAHSSLILANCYPQFMRALCITLNMDILNRLEQLNADPFKQKQIKKYLLACCKKLVKYRSSGNLEKGIALAKKYNAGYISWKKFHDIEYILEGEAFRIEFYSNDPYFGQFRVDKNDLADLKKIRVSKALHSKKANKYLIDLAYFVDSVFSYCSHPGNSLPDIEHSKFLCPVLFKRYFR
ncbi:hypothetical protein [Flavobacterium sp. W21_SRS_FM6]|uniref:hypothetical protein n=1 Tax=Flavobacterium sp. W21_SRS_FM6 TaxID=3240268 RepID=UPI003F8FC1AA